MIRNKKNVNNSTRPAKDITGVILAGGKSSRYGQNKALEKIKGVPLIERVREIMASLFNDLILITNTPYEYTFLKLPMYEDRIKGLGPIGGIYTGLEAIKNEAAFFVACDMPFLNKKLIRHIVSILDDCDAVVPRVDWKIEALHALYTKNCISPIKRSINSNEYQVIKVFNKIRIKYVEEDEIKTFDPGLKSFFNVNRPEEFETVVRLAGQ